MDFSQLEMYVSRSEQKKAHERLQLLAPMFLHLSKAQQRALAASEIFLHELQQLAAITSPAAKNRQIKRLGKLMLAENRHALVEALFFCHFDPAQRTKIQTWQARINLQDDNTLKQFVRQFRAAQYHTLQQLLLWIEYAKAQNDDELLAESMADFYSYIKEVALLSI